MLSGYTRRYPNVAFNNQNNSLRYFCPRRTGLTFLLDKKSKQKNQDSFELASTKALKHFYCKFKFSSRGDGAMLKHKTVNVSM